MEMYHVNWKLRLGAGHDDLLPRQIVVGTMPSNLVGPGRVLTELTPQTALEQLRQDWRRKRDLIRIAHDCGMTWKAARRTPKEELPRSIVSTFWPDA